MNKRLAAAAAATCGVVLVGGGAVGYAESANASTPAPSATATTNAQKHGDHKKHHAGIHALHATWVTRDAKDKGYFVTHEEIRGKVVAQSSTSITVQAADGFKETLAVNSSTKIHQRAGKKAEDSSLTKITVGDEAIVLGTGAVNSATAQKIWFHAPKAGTQS
ncbi:hypothetical protein [Branchiibius sp. NY16-3462-2]|uniref:hypothetical protein n=1 Tax=Branchiibius sp. NY16-3462-2 TaxID=1807500 RepID=UPI00079B4860|nr:hypothetical protein [Branchiibius sp. NY16-3462-2]KYH44426.1 hypothetical protein AZH51_07840 [Branchiibius sp. NY16-3462-2]